MLIIVTIANAFIATFFVTQTMALVDRFSGAEEESWRFSVEFFPGGFTSDSFPDQRWQADGRSELRSISFESISDNFRGTQVVSGLRPEHLDKILEAFLTVLNLHHKSAPWNTTPNFRNLKVFYDWLNFCLFTNLKLVKLSRNITWNRNMTWRVQ